MSNAAVGQLYKRVIEAVVEASRVDFEENGIDSKTLQTLQEGWQSRLTSQGRASFPWDPQPAPVQDGNSSTGKLNTQSTASPTSGPGQQGGSNGTTKQEAPYDTSFLNLPPNPSYNAALNSSYAQQRAAQLIKEQYGAQGNASVAAIHASGALPPGSATRPMNYSSPTPQPYNQQQTQQTQQPRSSPPIKAEGPSNGFNQSQLDGAADYTDQWDAIVMKRNATGDHEPLGRIAVDGFIRRKVEENQSRLEAGGLLVPLEEKSLPRRAGSTHKSKSQASTQHSDSSHLLDQQHLSAQFDGGDDDSDDVKDDDEDAINSDLDDSEDGLDDDGIESNMNTDTILCMYDKVQRTKNKWKCTLKDGVVTVDGKDYVFHKAQGEFEW